MLQVRVGDKTFLIQWEGGVLSIDGARFDARLEHVGPGVGMLYLDNRTYVFSYVRKGEHIRVSMNGLEQEAIVKDETALLLERFGFEDAAASAQREIRAPMPGLLLHVLVDEGEDVEEGRGLLVLEAMKMENEIRAPRAGRVAALHARPGEAVAKNALLLELED